LVCLTIFLLAAAPYAYTRDTAAVGYDFRTGDTILDATLGDLNLQTHGTDLSDFVSNLSLTYSIPVAQVENLLFQVKMSPADAYMAVGLAWISKKPLGVVVDAYKANRGQGWGVIAKNLGIKPGSKEFKALIKGGADQIEKVKGKGKGQGQGKGKGHKGK